ncbi:MAG: 2-amino-4-hydroxy-6-hydroxymethyldihydropteridine diphosphokinase [Gammaproteobacteria bacterium]|jgi:2-amino-4-hydroxy-6-hydroxymethyldihydropteridine diphosphokinase|nr:2-amino-4-hydroxy-6-hydroxymethyldihydropteridine diphosphokinase [Gammaproteobacteria bacterium]
MPEVFVGMGSNVEPHTHFRLAMGELESRFGPVDRSSVWSTEAVGFTGDAFLNMVLGWQTDLELQQLMQALGEVEMLCGRRRGDKRFGPRTMDLDLLLYGDEIHQKPPLPRPEILEYGFVLGPLAELAPGKEHPTLKLTFGQLWDQRRQAMPAMTPVTMQW